VFDGIAGEFNFVLQLKFNPAQMKPRDDVSVQTH
jgi:hypothetical protein